MRFQEGGRTVGLPAASRSQSGSHAAESCGEPLAFRRAAPLSDITDFGKRNRCAEAPEAAVAVATGRGDHRAALGEGMARPDMLGGGLHRERLAEQLGAGAALVALVAQSAAAAHYPYDWGWLGKAPSGQWVLAQGLPRCVPGGDSSDKVADALGEIQAGDDPLPAVEPSPRGARQRGLLAEPTEADCRIHALTNAIVLGARGDAQMDQPSSVSPRAAEQDCGFDEAACPPAEDEGALSDAAPEKLPDKLAMSCLSLQVRAAIEERLRETVATTRQVASSSSASRGDKSSRIAGLSSVGDDDLFSEVFERFQANEDEAGESSVEERPRSTMAGGTVSVSPRGRWRTANARSRLVLAPLRSSCGGGPPSPRTPGHPGALGRTEASPSPGSQGSSGAADTKTDPRSDWRHEIKRLRETLHQSANSTFEAEVWERCGIDGELTRKAQLAQFLGGGLGALGGKTQTDEGGGAVDQEALDDVAVRSEAAKHPDLVIQRTSSDRLQDQPSGEPVSPLTEPSCPRLRAGVGAGAPYAMRRRNACARARPGGAKSRCSAPRV
eukprot:CAMPEP_0176194098 /NCGR_PEP_ID=MMETSP0121_2-20121125/5828_1 /TAXON_ID=160619 /ORGANISM="Kryptoperidinium foliaceum, Strain CCMP 1326" /LENGTH=553 /DNA_ID=CAMNT_0017532839 /DNA_START=8 /DNA_END=1667 /DNA_ORIENTATION=-